MSAMEKDKQQVVLNGNFYKEENMDILTLIIALSSVMWYVIQRGKDEIWGSLSFGKWITIAVAAIAGFGLTFAFGLDILFACGLVESVSIAGQIVTGLVLMSGSSAVAEIIERIKGTNAQD